MTHIGRIGKLEKVSSTGLELARGREMLVYAGVGGYSDAYSGKKIKIC